MIGLLESEMPKVPQQIEFGRLNITHTIMSKRYLKELVEKKLRADDLADANTG